MIMERVLNMNLVGILIPKDVNLYLPELDKDNIIKVD